MAGGLIVKSPSDNYSDASVTVNVQQIKTVLLFCIMDIQN